MALRHAYSELGLTPGAPEAEVKAAWRRLVSQWHPDRNPSAGAVARMQRINHAFEAIRGAGFTLPGSARPAAPPAPESAAPAAPAAPPEGAGSARRGRTLLRKVKLTLEEAALGCTRVLQGQVRDDCAACEGAGHRSLGGACPQCEGSGAIHRRAWYGWISSLDECPACHGGGRHQATCEACDGAGRLKPRKYRTQVRIPPGVRHGDLLSVRGAGQRGPGAPGDLDLRIELLPHPFFALDADGTLRCEMPVDGFAWVAQRTLEVPTPEGLQPLAMQRDRLSYRLPGQGFPARRGGARADLVIQLLPTFPDELGPGQQRLLDELIAATPLAGRLGAWQHRLQAWQRGRTG